MVTKVKEKRMKIKMTLPVDYVSMLRPNVGISGLMEIAHRTNLIRTHLRTTKIPLHRML
jgi:hypothetical protein